jgi:hypothetical protein
MQIDWGVVWRFVWPILKEMLVAFLIALLALLGYDKYVPSRFVRRADEPRDGSWAAMFDRRLGTVADAVVARRRAAEDAAGKVLSENMTMGGRDPGRGAAGSAATVRPDARKRRE